jgi:PAS domain S-box-containing protein
MSKEYISEMSKLLRNEVLNSIFGFYFSCKADNSWTLIDIKGSFEKLTGLDADEFIGEKKKTLFDFFNQEDHDLIRQACHQLLSEKTAINLKLRLITASSPDKTIKLNAVIYINSDSIQIIEGFIKPVSDDDFESNIINRYFQSFQNAVDAGSAVLVTDINGNIIYVNDLFCFYSKYNRQELIGSNPRIVNSGFHPKNFFEAMWKTIKSGKIWRGEVKDKAKDGTCFWTDSVITPVFNNYGQVVRFLCVKSISTEKKNFEEALNQITRLNKLHFEMSDDLFYIIQPIREHGHIVHSLNYVSSNVVKYFGMTDILIKNNPNLFTSVIHLDDKKEVKLKKEEFLREKKPFEITYRVIHQKTGEIFWMLDHWYPVLDENNEIKEIICNAKNITALKEREEKLSDSIRKLEEKQMALMQFNYIISHNLKGPVNNISSLLDLLLDNDNTPEENFQINRFLKKSVTSLDEIILDLSKLINEKNQSKELRVKINLNELLGDILVHLEKQIEESRADVKVTIENGSSELFLIKSYIHSILFNLIQNALKYRSDKRSPVIEITAFPEKKNYCILIKDNGIGMDLEKYRYDIFKMYKQINAESEGKGMGLFMTKFQVESMGGALEVDSSPDRGTVFKLIFPLN